MEKNWRKHLANRWPEAARFLRKRGAPKINAKQKSTKAFFRKAGKKYRKFSRRKPGALRLKKLLSCQLAATREFLIASIIPALVMKTLRTISKACLQNSQRIWLNWSMRKIFPKSSRRSPTQFNTAISIKESISTSTA